MLIPKFTITNSILKSIGEIEAAREMILSASLIPAWEVKLKRQALEKTIYFGVQMEGNKILEEQVADIIDGREVMASEVDVAEVLNAQKTYQYLTTLAEKPAEITLEILQELHANLMERLMPPDQLGELRKAQIVIRDTNTGQISYSPPPAAEIEYLLEDLLNWLNGEGREVHPVIRAAISQLDIYRIHPFREGNLPTGRALTNLILKSDGYGLRGFLSIEEYFNQTLSEYFAIMQKVCNEVVMDTFDRDLTTWIEYFAAGVASETTKLKDLVRKISTESKVKDALGESMMLTERQMIIMDYLHRHKKMMNKDFRKIFPDHSDDTVLREIKFLKQKGLVKKIGTTKKAIYVPSDLKE